MEHMWELRLYLDDKAHDTFTMPLEDVTKKYAIRKELRVKEDCALNLDEAEFESMTFELINPKGEISWTYLVTKQAMIDLGKLVKKRKMPPSRKGPKLEAYVRHSVDGKFLIRELKIILTKKKSKKLVEF